SRKRPLPCAPCVWNPIGYSGSIFLINPGGVPVVTSASNPARRCAWVENTPVISAMRETKPILNDGWVSIIKKLARPHGLSREFISTRLATVTKLATIPATPGKEWSDWGERHGRYSRDGSGRDQR